ncbi:uncharacterized protein [Branchiostoma lanceolatum]|uniref:uncharacterized protein n=1 Tax=Branchiostoma lanceolatum TaxID=7740 RepID=UPI00345709CD
MLFYVQEEDNGMRSIHRLELLGQNDPFNIYTSGDGIEGVAVDWVSSNLYWTERLSGQIHVSRLDGSFRQVLIDNQDQPRGIAVHPPERLLFWTEAGTISRASLAGTDRRTVVPYNMNREPIGIAIDLDIDRFSLRLYWVDSLQGSMQSCNQTGGDVQVHWQANYVGLFGVTTFKDYVLWTDRTNHVIRMGVNNAKGSFVTTRLTELSTKPYGIRLYHKYQQQLYPGPCDVNNGGCEGLCLPTLNGRICGCGDDGYLHPDGQSCGSDVPIIIPDTTPASTPVISSSTSSTPSSSAISSSTATTSTPSLSSPAISSSAATTSTPTSPAISSSIATTSKPSSTPSSLAVSSSTAITPPSSSIDVSSSTATTTTPSSPHISSSTVTTSTPSPPAISSSSATTSTPSSPAISSSTSSISTPPAILSSTAPTSTPSSPAISSSTITTPAPSTSSTPAISSSTVTTPTPSSPAVSSSTATTRKPSTPSSSAVSSSTATTPKPSSTSSPPTTSSSTAATPTPSSAMLSSTTTTPTQRQFSESTPIKFSPHIGPTFAETCPQGQTIVVELPADAEGRAYVNKTISAWDRNGQLLEVRGNHGLPGYILYNTEPQQVVLEATDGWGMATICSFIIIVNDPHPPRLTCPADITRLSETPGDVISWDEPIPEDNSGQTVRLSSNHRPGVRFSRYGVYTVTYTAVDVAGNRATCDFSISIESPAASCDERDLPAVQNGRFRGCQTTAGVTTCTLLCESGFRPTVSGLDCLPSGRWDSSQVLSCLSNLLPVQVSTSMSFTFNDAPCRDNDDFANVVQTQLRASFANTGICRVASQNGVALCDDKLSQVITSSCQGFG